MEKMIVIKTVSAKAWHRVQGVAIALGWSGWGETLTDDFNDYCFRVYSDESKRLASAHIDTYLGEGSLFANDEKVVIDADNDFDSVVEFFKTGKLPIPTIVLGKQIIEFHKGKIKIDGNFVPNDILREKMID
jgi:hypothetical protein